MHEGALFVCLFLGIRQGPVGNTAFVFLFFLIGGTICAILYGIGNSLESTEKEEVNDDYKIPDGDLIFCKRCAENHTINEGLKKYGVVGWSFGYTNKCNLCGNTDVKFGLPRFDFEEIDGFLSNMEEVDNRFAVIENMVELRTSNPNEYYSKLSQMSSMYEKIQNGFTYKK